MITATRTAEQIVEDAKSALSRAVDMACYRCMGGALAEIVDALYGPAEPDEDEEDSCEDVPS